MLKRLNDPVIVKFLVFVVLVIVMHYVITAFLARYPSWVGHQEASHFTGSR